MMRLFRRLVLCRPNQIGAINKIIAKNGIVSRR
jgi:hypothetical protein